MLLRAVTTFHAPGGVTVIEGALHDSDDPVVKGRESLFEPAEAAVETPAPPAPSTVETGSARPGTKRVGTKRPKA